MAKARLVQTPVVPSGQGIVAATNPITQTIATDTQVAAQDSPETKRSQATTLVDNFNFVCNGFLDPDLPQVQSMLDLLTTRVQENRLGLVSDKITAVVAAMQTIFSYPSCPNEIRQELGGKLIRIIDTWLKAADDALDKGQLGIIEEYLNPVENAARETLNLVPREADTSIRDGFASRIDAISLKWFEKTDAAERAEIARQRSNLRHSANEAFQAVELSLKAEEENISANNPFAAARALPKLETRIAGLRTGHSEYLSSEAVDSLAKRYTAANESVTIAIKEHESKIDQELTALETKLATAKHKGEVAAASKAIRSQLQDIAECVQSNQYTDLDNRFRAAIQIIDKLPDPPRSSTTPALKTSDAAPVTVKFSDIATECNQSITKTNTKFLDLYPRKALSTKQKVRLADDMRKVLSQWCDKQRPNLAEKIKSAEASDTDNQDLSRLATIISETEKIYRGLIDYLDTMHNRWQTPNQPRVLASNEARKGALMATQFGTVISNLRLAQNRDLKSLETSYQALQTQLVSLMDIRRGPFAEKSSEMIDQSQARSAPRAISNVLNEYFGQRGLGNMTGLDASMLLTGPQRVNFPALRPVQDRIPEHYEILRDAVMRIHSRDADLYQALREAYRGSIAMPETIDLSKIDEDLALAQSEIQSKHPQSYQTLVDTLEAQRNFYQALEKSLGQEHCPNISELKATRTKYENLLREQLPRLLAKSSDRESLGAKATGTQFLFTHAEALTATGSFDDIHPLYRKTYEIERDINRTPSQTSREQLLDVVPEAVVQSGTQVGASDIETLPAHLEPFLAKYDALIEELEADDAFKSSPQGRTLGTLLRNAKALCEANLKQSRDLADIEPLTSDEQELSYAQLDKAHEAVMGVDYQAFPAIFRARLQDYVRVPSMQNITPKIAEKNSGILLMGHTLPAYLKMYFKESIHFLGYYYSIEEDGGTPIVDTRTAKVAQTSSITLQRGAWLVHNVRNFLEALLEAYDQRGDWSKSERSRLAREMLDAQQKCFEAQDMLMDIIAPGIREEKLDRPNEVIEIDLHSDAVTEHDNQAEVEALERKRILYGKKYRELRSKPLIPYAIKKYIVEFPHVQTQVALRIEKQINEELKSKSLDELIAEAEA